MQRNQEKMVLSKGGQGHPPVQPQLNQMGMQQPNSNFGYNPQ